MDAHCAGAHRVPITSDIAPNKVSEFAILPGACCYLPFSPFGQSGCGSERTAMLDSRAQSRDVGRCRKIARVDEKGCVQIGRRDLDTSATLRPDKRSSYRKALIRLDLGSSERSSGKQRLNVRTIGFHPASKEKLDAGSGPWRQRLPRLGNEARDKAMVLKVLTNSRQVANDVNAVTAKLNRIADT